MIDKVKEEIAQYYFYKKYPPSNDPLAYNFRWRDIPFDGCTSSKPFYDKAEEVINIPIIFKALELYQKALDGKLVELEENQELPNLTKSFGGTIEKVEKDYSDKMKSEGWRKVKELNID